MRSTIDPKSAFICTRIHYLESDSCGYCNCNKKRSGGLANPPESADVPEENTHITIGCQVEQMSCSQYDDFINRGFRRSGTFMYTGDMLRGCCRMYTIRTSMDSFKITKEHRQVVNRFKRAIGQESKSKGGFDLESLIEAEKASTRFYTRFEPAGYSDQKFELYKKYQIQVHNDDPVEVSKKQFKRFLCDTPFAPSEVLGTRQVWDMLNNWVENWGNSDFLETVKRIGPTHECYYLDDKLIAISVLDFLPSGLSSVYFIWDPDYAHLSLGTLSGIREIQMCQKLHLGYYYLGYYLDDCPKMRYKAKFGGEVLDIVNNTWVDLKAATALMKDDTFFILGDSLKDQLEPQLFFEKESTKWKGPINDISEELYNEETFKFASEISQAMQAQFNIDGFDLPEVLPGAMPMWAVLDLMGEMDEKLKVTIFCTKAGYCDTVPFKELSRWGRSYVIDFLRLFGPKRLEESIIIASWSP